jgi:hypothetical protein
MHAMRLLVLGLSGLFLTALPAVGEENTLPDQAKAILLKAEQIELYSLEPEPDKDKDKDKDTLQGWKILGKTVLKDASVRKSALNAVENGIGKGRGAKCFDPRHALRATHDGKTVDLVICFECGWVYVYYDKKAERAATLVTSSKPQETLDKILKDAGVPLAKKRTE